MAVVLRALTLLALTSASCALFVQEMVGDWLAPFVSANTLTLANRQRLIAGMALGGLFGVVVGGLILWRRGAAAVHRVAHLLAPLMLIGLVPPLCETAAWPSLLNVCIVIGAMLLLLERLLRMSFAAAAEIGSPGVASDGYRRSTYMASDRLRRWLPRLLVLVGVIGYAVYMSVFTLRMHGRFQTYNFDLGQYDNIFWSTLHGHPMRDYPLGLTEDWTELRNHASLSVFFLLPFYAIKPGGPILLIIQSCVIALGAIPLYRFTARRLPRGYAVVIVFAYLLYPPTHGMQFYDFHFQPIAATCVLFVIDLVDDRRYWLCALAFIIAAGCREDVSVGLAMLGTFLALSGHRLKAGLVMAVAGAAYFVLIRFIIMPSFGGWGFQDIYKDLMPAGAHNFGGIIATLVSNPMFTFVSIATSEKVRYMLQILLPLALLPVRRGYLVTAIVPGSIFTILTTQYAPTIDIGFQYSAHFTPYVFTAAVVAIAAFGMDEAGRIRRRAAIVTVIGATIICGVYWGAIPPRDRVHGGFSMMTMKAPTAAEIQKDKDIKELHALIPADASAAIGESEMTHVSRLKMKGLRDTWDADYILYSTSSYGSGAERALASGEFDKIAERPGLALLKRKPKTAPAEPTPGPPPPANPPPANAPPAAPAPLPYARPPGTPALPGAPPPRWPPARPTPQQPAAPRPGP
jgi:uncharacterized membrane protein